MKKIKISKKLKEESVNYLQNYLKQKRQRFLTKKHREYIKSLIEKKKKANEKEAELYINSSLFNLAFEELVRERKARKNITDDNKIDRNTGLISVGELILKMIEIVNEAHDKGLGEILNAG